jgi:hypothetical protein
VRRPSAPAPKHPPTGGNLELVASEHLPLPLIR